MSGGITGAGNTIWLLLTCIHFCFISLYTRPYLPHPYHSLPAPGHTTSFQCLRGLQLISLPSAWNALLLGNFFVFQGL